MLLGSNNIVDCLENCYMDYNLRAKTKPSDHIPVIATLKRVELWQNIALPKNN
jgi:exodeoxyribonuclease-3